MSERTREKDVLALRTAILCVGLSGVFLGLFVAWASEGKPPVGVVVACTAVGVVVASGGVFARPSASLSRPGRILAFWTLSALLVIELLVPLNYAGLQRRAKWDWTEGKIRSLSDKTVKVLDRVEKPLRITTFFIQRHPTQGPVFNVVKDLLDQYQRRNRHIVVEHVDPSRETERMLTLAKQLNLEDVSRMASIVLQYEGARKDVPIMSLLSMMPGADMEQPRADQIVFTGEQEFTSAILEITEKRRKELWFVANHGELSPDRDLFDIASQLRRDNFRVEKLDSLAEGVPDNCSVLVILRPNPKSPYTDRELTSLARYLGEGGKLFLGVNGGGNCGIEPLMGDFGIDMGRNYVVDQTSGRGTLSVTVKAGGWHEVARNLRDYNMRFDAARSVEPLPPPPGMTGAPRREAFSLLSTGRNCWAESDVEGLEKGAFVTFDPKTDRKGPLSVAVVHEQPDRRPDGQPLPKDAPRTRIVVVGSGDFLVAKEYSWVQVPPPEANVWFFYNAVNWLAEKESLISIPPKRFDYRPMDKLTESSERLVFWLTTVGMPAVVLVLGGVIWRVRRSG